MVRHSVGQRSAPGASDGVSPAEEKRRTESGRDVATPDVLGEELLVQREEKLRALRKGLRIEMPLSSSSLCSERGHGTTSDDRRSSLGQAFAPPEPSGRPSRGAPAPPARSSSRVPLRPRPSRGGRPARPASGKNVQSHTKASAQSPADGAMERKWHQLCLLACVCARWREQSEMNPVASSSSRFENWTIFVRTLKLFVSTPAATQ